MQPGVVPGAVFEFHAAKAAGGLTPGVNAPLTTQAFDTSGNGNHGTLTNFAGTPASGYAGATGSLNFVHAPGVMLCHDDSTEGYYTYVFPALQAAGVKATFYTITDQVDQLITWAQLQEMNAAGHDIANHTTDHANLTTLTQAEIEARVSVARDALVAHGLPRAASDVAYPYGGANSTVYAAMAATSMRTGRLAADTWCAQPLVSPYSVGCLSAGSMTLAQVGAYIDQARAEGRVLVILIHGVVPADPSATQWLLSDYEALLAYINVSGLPQYTISELATPPPGPYRLVFDPVPAADYVALPNLGVGTGGDCAYEAWFKDDGAKVAAYRWVVAEAGAGVIRWGIYTYDGGLGFMTRDATALTLAGRFGNFSSDGLWHHVLAGVAGGFLKLYVDAVDRSGAPVAARPPAAFTTLQIGAIAHLSGWSGAIPLGRMYPFAPTLAMAQQNYNAGPLWTPAMNLPVIGSPIVKGIGGTP